MTQKFVVKGISHGMYWGQGTIHIVKIEEAKEYCSLANSALLSGLRLSNIFTPIVVGSNRFYSEAKLCNM